MLIYQVLDTCNASNRHNEIALLFVNRTDRAWHSGWVMTYLRLFLPKHGRELGACCKCCLRLSDRWGNLQFRCSLQAAAPSSSETVGTLGGRCAPTTCMLPPCSLALQISKSRGTSTAQPGVGHGGSRCSSYQHRDRANPRSTERSSAESGTLHQVR